MFTSRYKKRPREPEPFLRNESKNENFVKRIFFSIVICDPPDLPDERIDCNTFGLTAKTAGKRCEINYVSPIVYQEIMFVR